VHCSGLTRKERGGRVVVVRPVVVVRLVVVVARVVVVRLLVVVARVVVVRLVVVVAWVVVVRPVVVVAWLVVVEGTRPVMVKVADRPLVSPLAVTSQSVASLGSQIQWKVSSPRSSAWPGPIEGSCGELKLILSSGAAPPSSPTARRVLSHTKSGSRSVTSRLEAVLELVVVRPVVVVEGSVLDDGLATIGEAGSPATSSVPGPELQLTANMTDPKVDKM
jgi:hypothetical protein